MELLGRGRANCYEKKGKARKRNPDAPSGLRNPKDERERESEKGRGEEGRRVLGVTVHRVSLDVQRSSVRRFV